MLALPRACPAEMIAEVRDRKFIKERPYLEEMGLIERCRPKEIERDPVRDERVQLSDLSKSRPRDTRCVEVILDDHFKKIDGGLLSEERLIVGRPEPKTERVPLDLIHM